MTWTTYKASFAKDKHFYTETNLKSIHFALLLLRERERESVCVCVCVYVHALNCSVVPDSFVTPWTVARQTPLSMGFLRQEYWSGLPFPSPGDLPHPGIEPASPVSPALAGGFFTTDSPGKPIGTLLNKYNK